jgi:hypothetical protein
MWMNLPEYLLRQIKTMLSGFALLTALVAVVVVLGSYLVSATQPYRGPTLFYFYALFFCALISRKWSTAILIFILPLLPNLANQVEYVLRPAVPYFVAYPGVDAIVGLFLGQLVRSTLIDKNLSSWLRPPPWPFGLVLLVVAISCLLTVDRNLWQSATEFSWYGVANNIFRFKHASPSNDLAALNDLLVHAVAMLLVICLLKNLADAKQKEDIVFKPLVVGLIVTALWAIFQSFSGFGLPPWVTQYRTNTFGFSALGFQPDIHAFAAHMLLGAVGLYGYMLFVSLRHGASNNFFSRHWAHIVVLACALSWIALILSKSRASLLFAIAFSLLMLLYAIKIKKINVFNRTFYVGSALLLIFVAALSLSGKFWISEILQQFQSTDLTNFATLNLLSAYRLEIFAGAWRMFSFFPLMGIGQGNFFHISGFPDFMGSAWVFQTGGENAHNYFLQTLAELGLVGIVSFLILFLLPITQRAKDQNLTPIVVVICAVFLGNIYSHSLVNRENLYLLAVFVALLYAYSPSCVNDLSPQHPHKSSNQPVDRMDSPAHSMIQNFKAAALLVLVSVVSFYSYQEVSASVNRYPFTYGADCYRRNAPFADGWTSGRLVTALPLGSRGIKFTLDETHPDVGSKPLGITLSIIDQSGNVLSTSETLNQNSKPFSAQVELAQANEKEVLSGVLQVSRCFTPRNFGLKDDTRKLGVHVKTIETY